MRAKNFSLSFLLKRKEKTNNQSNYIISDIIVADSKLSGVPEVSEKQGKHFLGKDL